MEMSEGFVKFVGIAIGVGLIGYGIFTWISNNPDLVFLIIFLVALVAVSAFVLMKFSDDAASATMYQGMPVDGPMKVNLRIEQINPRKHRLHVDIKMTKKDWIALQQTGLSNHTLFSSPHPKYPDIEQHFSPGLSLRVKYADFTNSQEAHDAKEECIRSLQAMRSRIDQQHNFVARPAEQVESLEI
jgi:hypothetical protein